jgi:hypothetical protein
MQYELARGSGGWGISSHGRGPAAHGHQEQAGVGAGLGREQLEPV